MNTRALPWIYALKLRQLFSILAYLVKVTDIGVSTVILKILSKKFKHISLPEGD